MSCGAYLIVHRAVQSQFSGLGVGVDVVILPSVDVTIGRRKGTTLSPVSPYTKDLHGVLANEVLGEYALGNELLGQAFEVVWGISGGIQSGQDKTAVGRIHVGV